MTRTINIVSETVGVEDIKSVSVDINGSDCGEYYSYPQSTDDVTINTEINTDLDAKGYPE